MSSQILQDRLHVFLGTAAEYKENPPNAGGAATIRLSKLQKLFRGQIGFGWLQVWSLNTDDDPRYAVIATGTEDDLMKLKECLAAQNRPLVSCADTKIAV